MRKSKSKAQGVVDFGTSPHGLFVDIDLANQETPEAFSLSPSAKPVLPLPGVYTSPDVLKSRGTLEAAAEGKPQLHAFELTECEFLHAYFAVEHDRNATRKAISKGLAFAGDLKATDSLWQKLQGVMFARLKGGHA
jgi:hypothetical protein